MKTVPEVDVVMTGSDPRGQGGIAAVVTILLEMGLFQRHAGHYIVSHFDRGRWSRLAIASSALCRMTLFCWRRRPAIVHAHCSMGGSFLRKALLLSIARRFGCATVLHLHGSRFREFATDEASWLRRRWIVRVLRRCSTVIALSETGARFVRELSPRATVRVVANGVPVPPAPCAAAADPCRILFLGQVGPRKGIFDLIEAAGRLRDEFPLLRLVIAGDGDLARARAHGIHHGLGDRVELLGWIGAAEKARQLERAAIFCMPSRHEGVPVAMLEAMAAARPVVVTPVGGIPDVVVDDSNGLLVPPADVTALETALRRLLRDPVKCRELGMRGYDTVRLRYQAQGMADRVGELYDALLAARAAHAAGAAAEVHPVYRR